MMDYRSRGRRRGGMMLILGFVTALVSLSGKVLSSPAFYDDEWQSLEKKNVESLARKGMYSGKRSVANLARNGMLPAIVLHDDDNSTEKRDDNTYVIYEEYIPIKRNIQAVMRNGNPHKRNIGVLARDGVLKPDSNRNYQKKESNDYERYSPFFQNPMPPLSEVPWDNNGMYDYMQGYTAGESDANKFNKRALHSQKIYLFHNLPKPTQTDDEEEENDKMKRKGPKLPKIAIYTKAKPKRYSYGIPFPEEVDLNDMEEDLLPNLDFENEDKRSVDETNEDEPLNQKQKRHIGSLARLGWLPTFRYSGTRYSRSGRTYRHWQYPHDTDFRAGRYLFGTEADAETGANHSGLPPSPVSSHQESAHQYQGIATSDPVDNSYFTKNIAAMMRNRLNTKIGAFPSNFQFRVGKQPKVSNKRYLVQPAVDLALIKNNLSNHFSVPARLKNFHY